ncbi:AfsR/SARP family transcriptional regulator [Ornithinicoccus halotolerans]|uniref:AfsR/SARP family transcriptional regulator n=1 Tax=Ornithinicoccus halotolerans TaxID=1748220 RepID=UPI001294B4B4|nr:BTAD domain-containing putative transcriptional regulator [Ornithinicoccus halotolerans]
MGEIFFGILGPLRVLVDDRPVPAPGGRQGQLLALLICRAGQTVSAERLVDELWGEDQPAHPGNALQQQVVKLRRRLGRHGPDTLVTAGSGYMLAASRETVDATRFEDLLAVGRAHLHQGRAEEAEKSLHEALALWRGEPLIGMDTAWAGREADRLRELRTVAVEERIEAAMALGRHTELVGELADLVAEHPLRERLRAQWMRALAAAGRQAEALQVYAAGRALLAEELGIDPSPMLQEAQADVLAQRLRPSVHAGPPWSPSVAPAPAPTLPRPVPAPTGPLLGRDGDLARLQEALSSRRLVTVTGPGGVGKTRLALQAAHDLAAGQRGQQVVVVELAGADPGDVPAAVLQAFGVDRSLGAVGEPAAVLQRHVGTSPTLLVLDNAEHVLRAVAGLVEDVLAGCGAARMLVTSREALGVDGEVVLPLEALPVPPGAAPSAAAARRWAAVELFRNRARAADLGFEIDDATAPAVAEVVRRLDGVPLALELAAARVRALGVDGLLHRLDDADVLADERRRALPDRHRTMHRTLGWSWDLLDDAERRAWMAAAVPAGPFDLSLLERLLPAAGARFTGLGAVTDLVDRSLLQPDRTAGRTAYRMLHPVRQHGLQRLADSGLQEVVRDAHAAAVEEAVRATDRTTASHWAVDIEEQASWLPEARQALRWRLSRGDRTGAQRLAGALGWTWYLTGAAAEGVRWLDSALGEPSEPDIGAADAQAMLWASALRVGRPASDTGSRWAQRARTAADDEVTPHLAGLFAANHRALRGDVTGALEVAAAQHPGGWLEGAWRLLEAQLLSVTGALDPALVRLGQAHRLLEEHGAWWASWAQASLVQLAEVRGDAAALRTAGQAALHRPRTRPRDAADVQLRCILAMAAALDGAADAAREHLSVAERASSAGAPGRAMVAAATGYVLSVAGHREAAAQAYQDAVAEDLAGLPFGALLAHWGLGHLALDADDIGQAVRYHADGVRAAHEVGSVDALARGLEGLAAAVAAACLTTEAASLLGAAEALRTPYGGRRSVVGGIEAQRTADHVSELLGHSAERAMEAGRRMTTQAALDLVTTLARRHGRR